MSATVIVHVRFAPDGTVTEIGERPAELPAQQWFNFLSQKVGANSAQALAGGRMVFRLAREQVDALKVEAAA